MVHGEEISLLAVDARSKPQGPVQVLYRDTFAQPTSSEKFTQVDFADRSRTTLALL